MEMLISFDNEDLTNLVLLQLRKEFSIHTFEITHTARYHSIYFNEGTSDKVYGMVYGYALAIGKTYQHLFEVDNV